MKQTEREERQKERYVTICNIVKQIPKGAVLSYGEVAILAGDRGWSRQVGYAMRHCSNNQVPCHRVVRHNGEMAPAFGGSISQNDLLKDEGIEFKSNGKIDMNIYSWYKNRKADI